jgi:hypothetical protein
MDWTEDQITRLRALWAEGHSTAEIGRRMGISMNGRRQGASAEPVGAAQPDPPCAWCPGGTTRAAPCTNARHCARALPAAQFQRGHGRPGAAPGEPATAATGCAAGAAATAKAVEHQLLLAHRRARQARLPVLYGPCAGRQAVLRTACRAGLCAGQAQARGRGLIAAPRRHALGAAGMKWCSA